MNRLIEYIEETIGIKVQVNPLQKEELGSLPMYLNQLYKLQKIVLAGRPCVLAEINVQEEMGIAQLEKHFEILQAKFNLHVIALFKHLEAYHRKRLIEKKIAFILLGKQMYVPNLFIDLKEYGNGIKKEAKQLSSTGQMILLSFILDKYDRLKLDELTFKELAVLFATNPMNITRASENLKNLDLIDIVGEREKFIHFRMAKSELWSFCELEDLFINPVLKTVYVDKLPKQKYLLKSNASALPEYTDMNPSNQKYYAVEKTIFYGLQKSRELVHVHEREGLYCLEVWKYRPDILNENVQLDEYVVDPLSLYLSLKNSHNERIEMALEQIIEKYTW